MDPVLKSLSRKAWGDLEMLHVVGYFAPEVTEEYVDLGLHPQLAYFPGRAAAFGEAGPGLTVATFYVFAPWLVEAALPAAWQTTTPEKVVAARRTGMSRALRKTLGTPDVLIRQLQQRESKKPFFSGTDQPVGTPAVAPHRWADTTSSM